MLRAYRSARTATPFSDLRRSFSPPAAVGNIEELGLVEIGVETDERGRIQVDEHFQTTAPGVYAAGDVIGPPALASASMEQGRVAACYACRNTFQGDGRPSHSLRGLFNP